MQQTLPVLFHAAHGGGRAAGVRRDEHAGVLQVSLAGFAIAALVWAVVSIVLPLIGTIVPSWIAWLLALEVSDPATGASRRSRAGATKPRSRPRSFQR